MDFDEDRKTALQMEMALIRARHNTLADIEDYCTGTAEKLNHYADLLGFVGVRKANLRYRMSEIEVLWSR